MTDHDVVAYIVSHWLMEHSVPLIMMNLICLGVPATRATVMQVIRKYVDMSTENTYPKAGVAFWSI